MWSVNVLFWLARFDDKGKFMAQIMRQALSCRHTNTVLLGKSGLTLSATDRGIVSRTGEQATWTFEETLTPDDFHRMKRGARTRSDLDLAGGYPIEYQVVRRRDGKCALYFSVLFPGLQWHNIRGRGATRGGDTDFLSTQRFCNRDHGALFFRGRRLGVFGVLRPQDPEGAACAEAFVLSRRRRGDFDCDGDLV